MTFSTRLGSLGSSTSVAGVLEYFGKVLSFNVSQQMTLVDRGGSTDLALVPSSALAFKNDFFSLDYKVLKVFPLFDGRGPNSRCYTLGLLLDKPLPSYWDLFLTLLRF